MSLDIADDYSIQTYSNVLRPLIRLAKTLIRNMTGILSYFKHWITNGKAEGLNNKIKTLKRQAYGYRDSEYFKLRLYHYKQAKALFERMNQNNLRFGHLSTSQMSES